MRTSVVAPPHARVRPIEPDPGGTAGSRRKASRVLLLATLAVLVALAVVVGVRITAAMLNPGPAHYSGPIASGAGPFAVGQTFRTDDAVVEVTGVELINGLSAQDLSNANHGIQNLVPPGQTQVQVTLRIVNDSRRRISLPTREITLLVKGNTTVKATSSTLATGTLGSGLSLEGSLGFVAPQDGSTVALQLGYPHRSFVVDLGRTDTQPATAKSGHQH